MNTIIYSILSLTVHIILNIGKCGFKVYCNTIFQEIFQKQANLSLVSVKTGTL